MGISTNIYQEPEFAWLNSVPQGAHLWRLFGSEVVDMTNNATLVNLHLSNAANHLETMLR